MTRRVLFVSINCKETCTDDECTLDYEIDRKFVRLLRELGFSVMCTSDPATLNMYFMVSDITIIRSHDGKWMIDEINKIDLHRKKLFYFYDFYLSSDASITNGLICVDSRAADPLVSASSKSILKFLVEN